MKRVFSIVLSLLAPQSGANSRLAFRDFHPVRPLKAFEHLSLFIADAFKPGSGSQWQSLAVNI